MLNMLVNHFISAIRMLLYLDAESLIRYGGILLVCLLVFCSVGVFVCFFLPVGGILFMVGILSATGSLEHSIFTICFLLILSCLSGSLAGYGIGRSTGNFFYTRKESRFYRRQYLMSTESFYKKYGVLTLIAGYFLPIIRTFAPLLAGIIRVKFQRFLICSVVGSVIFILAFVLGGFLIGSLPFLRPWLKYIVAVFILVVTIPLVMKIVRQLRNRPKSS